VCFLSLEDETGLVNVVCSPGVWQKYQRVGLAHGALRITGSLERSDRTDADPRGGALNIVAGRLAALRVTAQPGRLRSRDFR
jgi:error-prone DNA polymerase